MTKKTEAKVMPKLPMTVKQAADLWDMHPSRVKQLCEQERVKHQKVGGGETRAASILIMQHERPERLAPGAPQRKKKVS